jgi:hypothetical protein
MASQGHMLPDAALAFRTEAEATPGAGAAPRSPARSAEEDEKLPTNWMDRAIVAQTYPGRPMTTHHVLDTAAPFDKQRLLDAVDALVRSIPTLRSFVRETALGVERLAARDRWSRLDTIVTFCDVPVDLSSSGWFGRPFDLEQEEPFRVLHAPRHGGGYQLVFTLHHGVTDGVGALALFDALLAHYGALSGELGEPPQPVAPSGRRWRELLRRRGPRLAASLLLDNVRRAGRFTDQRASLLTDAHARAGGLRCAVLDVAPASWQRLRERAASLGCSRNDLMLTAFLRAAAAWRREHGMPEEHFRALIPVDLRGELGIGPTLQNHLGVIEADFTPAEIDAAALPRTVRERLQAERAPSRVLATPMALAVLTLLPPFALRGLSRWLDERPSSFMYSFLFSHIRVPDALRVPTSVRMRRIYCLSALPRQPGIGLTITAQPGAVTATLAYAPPRLTIEGAAQLLARFGAALDEV